jgi:hypothetical protein
VLARIADSALPVDGWLAVAEPRRTAASGTACCGLLLLIAL